MDWEPASVPLMLLDAKTRPALGGRTGDRRLVWYTLSVEELHAQPPAGNTSAKDADQNRLVAALSWLWVLSAIILLVKKDSPFVQFHARQGFVVFLASIILWILFGILGPFAWALQQLLQLAVFVVIVMGFVQALRGRWWTLPVLGTLAPKVRL